MERLDQIRRLLESYDIHNQFLAADIAIMIIEAQKEQIIKDFKSMERKSMERK